MKGERCETGGGVPNARQYDPVHHGFDNARLLMAVSRVTDFAAGKSAELAYGAWNPNYCSADAAREALRFFSDLTKLIDHYADQAAAAMCTIPELIEVSRDADGGGA